MDKEDNGSSGTTEEIAELVKEAGLRYVKNSSKGYTRVRNGEKYDYFFSDGTIITNEKIITRINKLVIPHAWKDVWICPHSNGHLQATGLDAKNRKQYRYHKEWDKIRNETKFSKMLSFGEILPSIRQTISDNLKQKKLNREKVLATVITILDEKMIRIGNKAYARENKTYGLTTLRNKHVKNLGTKLQLEFVGKKNIEKKVVITDRRLASIIRKCKEIPGYDLFQYYDENNEPRPIASEDVNNYLKEITGADITAKDFRTWGGSTIAIKTLLACEPCEDEKTLKKNIVTAIKEVSGCLGNTPTVCKGYYIHPIVIEKYSAKEITEFSKSNPYFEKEDPWLSREEKIFLELLKTMV